jgi:hypothetical protein
MGKVAIDKKAGKVTLESLAQLRGEVISLKGAFKMCQGKVEEAKRNAYYFEDVLEAMSNKAAPASERVIKWSLAPPSTPWQYNWHVTYKPLLFRLSALFAAVLSVFSYLGIIGTMNGVGPSVSVYFLAVHDDDSSASGICVFVLATLSHVIFTIIWSVFQMKISNLMELLPGQTTPSSLSVNARVCANLSSPLAFFYLGWIYENGLRTGSWTDGAKGGTVGEGPNNQIFTAFSKFYQIDIIPVMSESASLLPPPLDTPPLSRGRLQHHLPARGVHRVRPRALEPLQHHPRQAQAREVPIWSWFTSSPLTLDLPHCSPSALHGRDPH